MHNAVARALTITLLLLLSGPLAASTDEAAELIGAGGYQAALERLAAEPVTHRSRLLRADALAGLKRGEEAERLYRELIREFPEDPAPYNNLATLYAATGRLQEASELLNQAMQSDPRYAAIYKNLSHVYVEMSSKSYARALRMSEPQLGLQLLTLDYREPPLQLAAAEPQLPVPQTAPMVSPLQLAAVESLRPEPQASSSGSGEAASLPLDAVTPPPPAFDAGGAIAALTQWAAAWSAQDVAGYLGAYDADYLPPRGLSLAQWQAERRLRLLQPGTIEVSLSDFEVSSGGGGSVTVKAVQRYRSDHYRDRTRKGFVLVPRDGGWKIGDEYTIEVIN
jgi:tetratricopeptide (TPR) repeat protein